LLPIFALWAKVFAPRRHLSDKRCRERLLCGALF